MIPIKLSFKGLLSLALFFLFIKFMWWFDEQKLWIALPFVILVLLVGVYHIKYAPQIFNGKQWYNRLLNYEAKNEKDIKLTGYLLIFISVIFSMIAFFIKK